MSGTMKRFRGVRARDSPRARDRFPHRGRAHPRDRRRRPGVGNGQSRRAGGPVRGRARLDPERPADRAARLRRHGGRAALPARRSVLRDRNRLLRHRGQSRYVRPRHDRRGRDADPAGQDRAGASPVRNAGRRRHGRGEGGQRVRGGECRELSAGSRRKRRGRGAGPRDRRRGVGRQLVLSVPESAAAAGNGEHPGSDRRGGAGAKGACPRPG